MEGKMYWKRAALIFLLIIISTAAFEVTFWAIFQPGFIVTLRSRFFEVQQTAWFSSLIWLVFLASLTSSGLLMWKFRKQGVRGKFEYILWLGLMGVMGMSALILLRIHQ
jgi:hypothetical protein